MKLDTSSVVRNKVAGIAKQSVAEQASGTVGVEGDVAPKAQRGAAPASDAFETAQASRVTPRGAISNDRVKAACVYLKGTDGIHGRYPQNVVNAFYYEEDGRGALGLLLGKDAPASAESVERAVNEAHAKLSANGFANLAKSAIQAYGWASDVPFAWLGRQEELLGSK